MSTRRRGWYSTNRSFSKNIKDYIVPIIWWVLILFLIWSMFFKKTAEVKPTENQVWIAMTSDKDTKATIFYAGWDKKELSEGMSLYKSEKVSVLNWKVKLADDKYSFNLNKLWELKYLEDGWFSLNSWDVWIDTKAALNVEMKFVKLKISENSHVSLAQNEVNSTIYVISWTVEVSNQKWRSTVLSWGEKIEVSRAEASDEKIDLSLKKQPIDTYFMNSDWFVMNKWNEYLKKEEEKNSSTGTTTTWTTNTWTTSTGSTKANSKANTTWKSKYLTFSNLLDESNVSSNSINISGAYDVDEVSKVDINWKIATLNPSLWTFKVEWVSVPNKTNDLVFKVFNKNEDLVEKFVYTVYYDAGAAWWWNTSWQNNNTAWTWSNTFNVDGSKFAFTAPTTGATYTTYEDFVTIRGTVSAPNIDTVTVNDLKLWSFNWTTWRYHARDIYGTLADWTNVYEVKYFSGWSLVYKNYFTIVKKTWSASANNSSSTNTWNNTNSSSSNTTKNNQTETETTTKTNTTNNNSSDEEETTVRTAD